MRILIASPYLPWPSSTGGNAAQFSALKCLQEDHQFTLVCPIYDRAHEACARDLQASLPKVHVRAIYCGSESAARFGRPNMVVRLARRLVRGGRRLLLPPAPAPATAAGASVPYYPFGPLPDRYIEALQEELAKEVDLCQMEFAEMLPLGTWFPPDIPRLFIQHQIHFVYASRFLEAYGTNSHAEYLVSVMKAQEVLYLQKYHGVITFSEQDRQVLLPYVPPDRLFTSPFPIPTDPGITRVLPPAFDGRFLFLGSAEHGPNRDALEWLITKIWPEILRQLPTAQLTVIGYWSKPVEARLTAPSIKFSGYVRDLGPTMRGGIMLVPLRIGSGIRVKIMVAMAQGVPVVSTSVGCEGLQVSDGEELLVRDGESEFAAAAIRLARDHDLWHKVSSAGLSAVMQHYSPADVRRRRNEIYAALTKSERPLHTHAK